MSVKELYPVSRPSLNLDFTNGSFDPRITFSRNSKATRFNRFGVLETVLENVPRIDYDPITRACKGLLIEEQRTNSIRNNTMQGAMEGTPGTLPTNMFVSAAAGLSTSVSGVGVESGLNYIDLKIIGTASAAGYFIVSFETGNSVSASTGQNWTESLHLTLQSGSMSGLLSPRIAIDERAGGFLTSQEFSIKIPAAGRLIENRISQSFTVSNAGTTFIKPYLQFSVSNGSVIDATIRIGMQQLEQGAFATSVIPTSGTAATRAADVAKMEGANFSSWYRQDEGTLFVESDTNKTMTSAGSTFVVSVNDATGSNLHRIFRQSDAQPVMQTIVAGVAQTTYGFGASWKDTNKRRMAYSYKLNSFSGVLGGGVVQNSAVGTIPAVNQMEFGGAGSLNGHISRLSYYRRRLSNTELQAITTQG